jgi:deoxyribodipyrimidine photo-lyase
MSRDQRVNHNWALLAAAEYARQQSTALSVVFCLAPSFLGATERQYSFMLKGLREVEQALARHGIPFILLLGEPPHEVINYCERNRIGALFTDFSPLRVGRHWRDAIATSLTIPFFEVDAHNCVPTWVASPKQEWAAATFRPKITRHLADFLTPFPELTTFTSPTVPSTDWERIERSLTYDHSVPAVLWCTPGEQAAQQALNRFIAERLTGYATHRNNPARTAQSQLSPYLHFGQLSAQHIALSVQVSTAPETDKEDFLEELIVRRELADNFCFYNPHYDSFAGLPSWAQKTLNEHRDDPREQLYTREQLEQAQTHDPIWNAAQQQLTQDGTMHGYLRMYWAKQILLWSATPEEALAHAIFLNDRYQLDGRDPNGYVGIAWSIGGLHDRPWFQRPVQGLIRAMTAGGITKKFPIHEYIERVTKNH